MALSTKTKAEQDLTRHTLGHIITKLKGRFSDRITFVIVEGSDDLAFYKRFFDLSSTSVYYSTKKDEGNVIPGGCQELQNIVSSVLLDGRTDKIVGILDTDYRKYKKKYKYPKNIFHTDFRDMEMTALNTSSVNQALSSWINGYEKKLRSLEPILRYAGRIRILNDLFGLGCNFKKKCKINCVYDENSHYIYSDWQKRYHKKFINTCLKRNKQTGLEYLHTLVKLLISHIHYVFNSYDGESFYDLCHGHDTIKMLSLSLVNNAIYSEDAIWEKCFDAYTVNDFKNTRLYSSLYAWQTLKGVSLFI